MTTQEIDEAVKNRDKVLEAIKNGHPGCNPIFNAIALQHILAFWEGRIKDDK